MSPKCLFMYEVKVTMEPREINHLWLTICLSMCQKQILLQKIKAYMHSKIKLHFLSYVKIIYATCIKHYYMLLYYLESYL